jgi:hypothetical protein
LVLLALLPLGIGVASAQAFGGGFGGEDGQGSWGGWGGGSGGAPALIRGTVVSVDSAANTITANVDMHGQEGEDGPWMDDMGEMMGGPGALGAAFGPTNPFFGAPSDRDVSTTTTPPAPVTIKVGPTTMLALDGASATLSQFAQGDEFLALLDTSNATSVTDALNNPALAVVGRTRPKFFGFVGSVQSVDTTANTVTVTINGSSSSVLAPGSTETFAVGDHTMILSSSPGRGPSALTGVSKGDMVAGGLWAPGNSTAAQLSTIPLMVLIDVPGAGSSASTGSAVHAFQMAERAMGVRMTTPSIHHHGRSHHHGRNAHANNG